MKLSCKDVLSSSFCISIDKSRFNSLKCVFRHVFGTVPRVFEGYTSNEFTPVEKCSMSHQSIVRMAMAMDMPYVCIFEDDAYPMHEAPVFIDQALDCTPEDAKILLLGYNQINKSRGVNEKVCLIEPQYGIDFSVWGSHAYVIFRRAYNEYISIWEENVSLGSDGYFSRISPVYAPVKDIFIQRCDNRSMNGHVGYIWNNVGHEKPPDGFRDVSSYTIR